MKEGAGEAGQEGGSTLGSVVKGRVGILTELLLPLEFSVCLDHCSLSRGLSGSLANILLMLLTSHHSQSPMFEMSDIWSQF